MKSTDQQAKIKRKIDALLIIIDECNEELKSAKGRSEERESYTESHDPTQGDLPEYKGQPYERRGAQAYNAAVQNLGLENTEEDSAKRYIYNYGRSSNEVKQQALADLESALAEQVKVGYNNITLSSKDPFFKALNILIKEGVSLKKAELIDFLYNDINFDINTHLFPKEKIKINKPLALADAIKNKNELVTEMLLNDLNLTAKEARSFGNALHEAVLKKDEKMVDRLLALGADVNALGRQNKTPLQVAVEAGNVDMAQHLIMNGANAHASNELVKSFDEIKGRTEREAMGKLLNEYREAEIKFEKDFLPAVKKMVGNLDKKQGVSTEYMVQEFNKVLQKVYGVESKQSFVSKLTGEDKGIEIAGRQLKLGFWEEAKIVMESGIKAALGEQSYQQIKFEKLSEAFYDKIKDTKEFKALAAPHIVEELKKTTWQDKVVEQRIAHQSGQNVSMH